MTSKCRVCIQKRNAGWLELPASCFLYQTLEAAEEWYLSQYISYAMGCTTQISLSDSKLGQDI